MAADDERRAEVEAVARVMVRLVPNLRADEWGRLRPFAEEALDRVRDARGDDELRAENERLRELYANQAGLEARGWTIDHLMECEEALRMAEARVGELEAARSPQGEDHETDWWYWRCTYCGRVQSYRPPKAGPGAPMCDYGHRLQPMERTHLSRVSPSRDGTVAVERLVEALRRTATILHGIHPRSVGVSLANCSRGDCRERAALLAEFSPSTGDREGPNPGTGHGQ